MYLKSFLTTILIAAASCSYAAGFVKNGNNVTINVASPITDGAKIVCLQVINDNIIRVRATIEDAFPEKNSLIIVPQKGKPQFDVTEDAVSVRVKAKNVQAVVEKTTGRITFYDASGKTLLKEAENGKTFKPFRVPERELGVPTRQLSEKELNGLTWRALFENQPEEKAIYGLGQHQAEEMNMLGKNEELYQYNTKVSVPWKYFFHAHTKEQ